jgi:hypothetical protein
MECNQVNVVSYLIALCQQAAWVSGCEFKVLQKFKKGKNSYFSLALSGFRIKR